MFKTHRLINVPILECPAGTYGYNCAMKCPLGNYGILCAGICNCSRYETCNPSEGCYDEQEYFKSRYGIYKVFFSPFVFCLVRFRFIETLRIDTKYVHTF